MRRLFVIVAVIILVMVVVWMAHKPVARFNLGPGRILVVRPDVSGFLAGDGVGGWARFDAASRTQEDGVMLLPGKVIEGRPALGPEGGMVALVPDGLVRITGEGDRGEMLVPRTDLPEDPRLVGIPGEGPAVVSGATDGGRRLYAVRGPEAEGAGRLRVLVSEGVQAHVPEGGDIVCSPWSSHVAFEGADGWEAWALSPGSGPRVVARDCRGWGALFAPDGERLIVPGQVDGLWQLGLDDGRLSYMADGNLGPSRRVRHVRAFHRGPDRLVGAEWSRNGVLHLFTTHLGGGGKYQFKVGFMHDYSAALSWDGNLMVYCQSSFDEDADGPFDEAIWCLDQTTSGAAAVFVDDRRAGQADSGPFFIGRSDAFVYVADGEIRGVVFHRPSLETPP